MFILFKAYGKFNPTVYYGYKRDGEDIKKVIGQTLKTNHSKAAITLENRADYRLVEIHGGLDNIMIEEIDIFDTEEEAWCARNDLRVDDVDSITGPTPFPINLANRVEKKQPGLMAKWKKAHTLTKAKTAREAFRLGKWSNDQIKGLRANHSRKEIVKDLDGSSPNEFALKYSI